MLATPGCARNRNLPTQLAPSKITTIGVNSYLWRAAVDTVSFAPLLQADSSSGVIITDWYANPKAPGERVKLTVAVLDQDLRADALRVAASRQVYQNGAWVDAPVTAATVQKLEDIILTRAPRPSPSRCPGVSAGTMTGRFDPERGGPPLAGALGRAALLRGG
jgi:hypothetical protein